MVWWVVPIVILSIKLAQAKKKRRRNRLRKRKQKDAVRRAEIAAKRSIAAALNEIRVAENTHKSQMSFMDRVIRETTCGTESTYSIPFRATEVKPDEADDPDNDRIELSLGVTSNEFKRILQTLLREFRSRSNRLMQLPLWVIVLSWFLLLVAGSCVEGTLPVKWFVWLGTLQPVTRIHLKFLQSKARKKLDMTRVSRNTQRIRSVIIKTLEWVLLVFRPVLQIMFVLVFVYWDHMRVLLGLWLLPVLMVRFGSKLMIWIASRKRIGGDFKRRLGLILPVAICAVIIPWAIVHAASRTGATRWISAIGRWLSNDMTSTFSVSSSSYLAVLSASCFALLVWSMPLLDVKKRPRASVARKHAATLREAVTCVFPTVLAALLLALWLLYDKRPTHSSAGRRALSNPFVATLINTTTPRA